MTDNEIIKALECCVSEKDTCQNCPFQELKHYDYENGMFEIMPNGKQYDDWSCERWLNVAVLDLITRQQAIVEKSEKVEYFADKTIATLQAENERLEVENQSLRGAANSLKIHYEEAQAKIERLEVENSRHAELEQGCYVTGVKNIKAVAYKEFAERVKKEAVTRLHYGTNLELEETECVEVEDIDNLLKEMVGEKQ